MTKVSVGLGMTLKLSSGGGFNMFKPEILIADIDLDGAESTASQLQEAIDAVQIVYGAVEEKMTEIIQNSEIEEKRETVTELAKLSHDLDARIRKLELGGTSQAQVVEEKKEKGDGW